MAKPKQGVAYTHPTYGKQKEWPRIVIPMPPQIIEKLDQIWHKRMLRNRAATIHALIDEAAKR